MLADGGDEGFLAAVAADDESVVPCRLQGRGKIDETADAWHAGHRAAGNIRKQGGETEKADISRYQDGHGAFVSR